MTLKVGKRAGHIYIGKNRNGLTTGQGRRPLIGMAEDCTFILGGYNRWSQEWPVRISDHFVTIALDNVKGGPDKNTYLKNVFFANLDEEYTGTSLAKPLMAVSFFHLEPPS